jgi:hypothetical protein
MNGDGNMPLRSLFGCHSSELLCTVIRRIVLVFLLTSSSLLVLLSNPATAQTSVYEKVLAKRNIGTDPTSLAKYLQELHPTQQQRERVESLIRQLGDSSFSAREAAMAKLLDMPKLPTEALLVATARNDAEIRWRARRLLDVGKPEAVKVLHAVLQVIAAKKTPGLTAELLAAIPLCDQHYLESAARRAIEAAARRQDAAILRKALRGKHVQVRVAAASALGRTLEQDARDDLYPLLKDRENQVQLAAARAIADFGDRKCLETLLAMLDSGDLRVRVSAATALRQLSGKHLGFAAYDTAEKRAKIVAQWKAWVDGDGKTAKLIVPLKRFDSGRGNLGGNTLLAFGYNNKVAECDPTGKEIWTYAASRPYSAEKMASGNVLIAEFSGNRVIQVSPQGKVVWQYKISGPFNAKPLRNGNVLIAQFSGTSQVIEVNPEGKVVWKYAVRGMCSDVHRLENGNTLIASFKDSVMEVTPAGKVVWEYPEQLCFGCQPLPGGNVLIAQFHSDRVIEVTREKKIVWEYRHAGASDVFRLPNGNTLITGKEKFIEVTPQKKIVWSKGGGGKFGSARR